MHEWKFEEEICKVLVFSSLCIAFQKCHFCKPKVALLGAKRGTFRTQKLDFWKVKVQRCVFIRFECIFIQFTDGYLKRASDCQHSCLMVASDDEDSVGIRPPMAESRLHIGRHSCVGNHESVFRRDVERILRCCDIGIFAVQIGFHLGRWALFWRWFGKDLVVEHPSAAVRKRDAGSDVQHLLPPEHHVSRSAEEEFVSLDALIAVVGIVVYRLFAQLSVITAADCPCREVVTDAPMPGIGDVGVRPYLVGSLYRLVLFVGRRTVFAHHFHEGFFVIDEVFYLESSLDEVV